MATKKAIDPKQEIINHLTEQERSYRWLSKKSDIPYGTIYGILIQGTMDLDQERLDKINTALGTDFKLPE